MKRLALETVGWGATWCMMDLLFVCSVDEAYRTLSFQLFVYFFSSIDENLTISKDFVCIEWETQLYFINSDHFCAFQYYYRSLNHKITKMKILNFDKNYLRKEITYNSIIYYIQTEYNQKSSRFDKRKFKNVLLFDIQFPFTYHIRIPTRTTFTISFPLSIVQFYLEQPLVLLCDQSDALLGYVNDFLFRVGRHLRDCLIA